MNVLLVSSVVPIRGGVATFIDTISSKLRKIGYGVEIINVVSNSKAEFTLFKAGFVKVISKALNNDLLFWFSFITAKYILRYRTYREMSKRKYDILHVQDINAFNAVYKACKRKGVRLILNVHGHLYNGGTATRVIKNGTWLSNRMLLQEVKAYMNAEHIIAVSEYSYDFIKRFTDESKITILKNFVDTAEFHPCDSVTKKKLRCEYNFNENDFIVIHAGRISKSKGVENILQGVCDLEEISSLKLIVAGSGSELESLVDFSDKNKIESRVKFVGEVEKEELIKLYNLADAYIMASTLTEGTPMALLEAMACGLPIITTAVGGVSKVVRDMDNALVIEERSNKSISKAIKLLYEDSGLRIKISGNALLDIKNNYSVDVEIDKVLELYFK